MTGPRRPPGATLREMCGYQWVCTPSRTSAAVAMGLSALVHQAAASWPSRFVAAQPDGALLAGQLLHMVCIFPIAGGRTLGWVESGLEQIVSWAQVPTWIAPIGFGRVALYTNTPRSYRPASALLMFHFLPLVCCFDPAADTALQFKSVGIQSTLRPSRS